MRNSKDVEEAKIEMQTCEAYETISAVKRQCHATIHVRSDARSQR